MSVERSALNVERSAPRGAVFLSYASQDAEAAKRIVDALRAAGIEVWFDAEGGLEHGDEWDAKIRRQIKECVLFIPIISANTQAREEGYFRLEWDLAAERARTIASGVAFILPVVIDGTRESAALVPDRFRSVQWTKLPGGQVPADVLQRLLKLWSHRTGLVKHLHVEQETGRLHPVAAAPAGPKWLKPILASSAIVIAVLAITLWQKSRTPSLVEPPVVPVSQAVSAGKPPPGPAAPKARDWPKNPELKRAMTLIEGLDSIPDDFALAEQIVKPIIERAPTDLEAVTVMARVQSHYMRRGFDRSDERSALARLYAERALQLGPDEPEALYAEATYLFSRETDDARTERLLRRAMELDPGNPRPGRLLADLFNATHRPAEAIAQGLDNVRRFPRDGLTHYDLARTYKDQGRYEEFDRELDATLAIVPLPNAIVWKARLQFGLHNDLAGMKTWLDRVPERVRGTERAVFSYFLYGGFGGDPESGLAALRGFPQKWFTDFEYAGPTALLNASLLELQGKTELARQQYEAALAEIQRMRTTEPGRIGLNNVEFWTLLGLGRRDEALASHRRMIEGLRRPFAQYLVNGWWFSAIPGSLLLGERATALTLLRESLESVPESRAAFRLRFQIDPRMAPFRDDPEISALLRDPAPAAAKPAASIPADDKSVAVLAFANLSDDKNNEYFSDGISEELLTVLQKIPGLKVSARTSAFSFKGKNATAQEIGQTLGVANLVEGSVRKAASQVRITARLSRADTGEQLWAESYTRDLKDVFAVQSELAQAIVVALRAKLLGETGTEVRNQVASQVSTAQTGGTTNVEAHELYLQGKYFANQPSLANIDKAVDYFQRAVDADGSFALAWAALGRTVAVQTEYLVTTSQDLRERFARARRAVDRALALAPELADGYFARIEIQTAYDYDWVGARESTERTLILAPSNALFISYASQLAGQFGDLEKGLRLGRQAAELDPVNAEVRYWLARVYQVAGRLPEAEAEFRRAAELSPSVLSVHRQQSVLLVQQGRAEAAVAEARLEGPEWSRQAALAVACWAAQDVRGADAALARLIAVAADSAGYQVAEAYAFRGEADHAFAWLERAYLNRDSGMGWVRVDPLLKNLRSDPRWPALIRKVGLADDQLK